MASETIRNPQNGYRLTPENSAMIIVDYQPIQVSSIRSTTREDLVFPGFIEVFESFDGFNPEKAAAAACASPACSHPRPGGATKQQSPRMPISSTRICWPFFEE